MEILGGEYSDEFSVLLQNNSAANGENLDGGLKLFVNDTHDVVTSSCCQLKVARVST